MAGPAPSAYVLCFLVAGGDTFAGLDRACSGLACCAVRRGPGVPSPPSSSSAVSVSPV